jgi:hypothetical protein
LGGFSTNLVRLNQALEHTLRLPRGLSIPILDADEPSVYFHLDTTGRIEGSLAIEVPTNPGRHPS